MTISFFYYGKIFGGDVFLNTKNGLCFGKQLVKKVYQWDNKSVPIKTIKIVVMRFGYMGFCFWWILPYEH